MELSIPASVMQDLIQRPRVAGAEAVWGFFVIINKEEQEGCLKGPVRDQYSRQQATGQTRLLSKEGSEKDWREPEVCFFRKREREKETPDGGKETDEYEIEASSAVRIKVANANTVTSLRES